MAIRPTSDHERERIKAACRRALRMAGGGDSFCHSTRVGAPTLSNHVNPDKPDMHMPLDIAVDLDRDIGKPVILTELARIEGYRLVRDGSNGAPDAPGLADAAAIAGEAGDVVRKFAEAMADGRIDAREDAELRREADEALAAIHRLLAKLDGAGGA